MVDTVAPRVAFWCEPFVGKPHDHAVHTAQVKMLYWVSSEAELAGSRTVVVYA